MEFVKYDIITRYLKLVFAIRCDIGNVQDIYAQHILVEKTERRSKLILSCKYSTSIFSARVSQIRTRNINIVSLFVSF